MSSKSSMVPNRGQSVNAAAVCLISSRGGLDIGYLNVVKIPDLGQYRGGFKQLLADIDAGRFTWPAFHYEPYADIATALSLGANDDCYVVYVLDSSLRARFSTSLPPFADGERSSVDLFDATCVISGVAGVSGDPAPSACSIAYFVADFKKHAVPGKKHKNRFNVNLEVASTMGGVTVVTPIIVDPDIRWPPLGPN